ncbi:MAG: hypothetical protein ACI37Q_03675 [Candidatus Gastranaerophilaceae bacterium]
MKVSSVQSPNFGMALRINKNAQKSLKELPMESLNELKIIGERLKDTKYYHIGISDKNGDIVAKLESDKGAYFGFFNDGPWGYHVKRYAGLEKDGKSIPDENEILIECDGAPVFTKWVKRHFVPEKPEPVYDCRSVQGSLDNLKEIRELSDVAIILDEATVQKYAQELAKQKAQDEAKAATSKAVDNLLDEFGV